MVQYVITPWRAQGELLIVRSKLYQDESKAPNNSHRREAVSLVSVWVQRGNCPHLVESTAIITSAILNDVPGNSSYCVRAAYSAAFCRFVTGLLDSHQDKRRKSSMYSVAKTLGLPATYVELRHQATHEELPSLPKLRIAARKALKWIWDFYWKDLTVANLEEEEAEEGQSIGDVLLGVLNGGDEKDLTGLLKEYDSDELLTALEEVEEASETPAVLLQAIKLRQKIYDVEELKSTKSSAGPGSTGNLDDFRVEMLRMEKELGDEEQEKDPLPMITDLDNSGAAKEQGWTRWEGPWVPKPIGVV